MDHSLDEASAERRDNFLASAAEADKQSAASKDDLSRTAWKKIANSYRDLAAALIRKSKL